ncbi:MAG TPA: hypothetical protein VIX82_16575, partial [Solirubrobacteraceae bacterium]
AIGRHTFSVTATSNDGQSTTAIATYTIVPVGSATARISPRTDGTTSVHVQVPGSGRIAIFETLLISGTSSPSFRRLAHKPFGFAHAYVKTADAGDIYIHLIPTKRGRWLMRHHSSRLTLSLWVTYTPQGGHTRTIAHRTIVLPAPSAISVANQAQLIHRASDSASVTVSTTAVQVDGTKHCHGIVDLSRTQPASGWLLHRIQISCS